MTIKNRMRKLEEKFGIDSSNFPEIIFIQSVEPKAMLVRAALANILVGSHAGEQVKAREFESCLEFEKRVFELSAE